MHYESSIRIESWLKLEEIFSPDWRTMRGLDPREGINWELLEQILLGSAVAAGCALRGCKEGVNLTV